MALPSNDINDLFRACFAEDDLGNVALRIVVSALAAESVSYEADDPTKWSGSPPTTIQDAVDRIAAVVGATPIP